MDVTEQARVRNAALEELMVESVGLRLSECVVRELPVRQVWDLLWGVLRTLEEHESRLERVLYDAANEVAADRCASRACRLPLEKIWFEADAGTLRVLHERCVQRIEELRRLEELGVRIASDLPAQVPAEAELRAIVLRELLAMKLPFPEKVARPFSLCPDGFV